MATDSWGGGTQPCPLWGSVPLDSGGTALGRSVARLLGEGRVKEQAPPPLPLGARQTHLHITGVAPFVTGQWWKSLPSFVLGALGFH